MILNSAKISSWLTIVANVGLLVGMALVVYQIDQNSQLARMALVNEGNVASNQFWANLMGENPTDVIAMAVECPEAMTYSDFIAMDAFLFTGMNILYRDYALAQEGIFTEEDWQESVEAYASWYLANSFGRVWWHEEAQYFFADDFVDHVDLQLQGPARDSYAYWLLVREQLLGSGYEENINGESSCPHKPNNSDTTDTENRASG